jgi:hypothetical protein
MGSHGVPVEMNCLGGFGVGKAHGPASSAFQRAVNGASVSHEIRAGPGVGREERVWKEIALQSITARARQDDVAGVVNTTVRERMNVVQRGGFEVEPNGAIDAAASTIAHRGALDRALVTGPAKMADARVARAASNAGETGEHDAVMLSATGHCTSRIKRTPRDRKYSRGGAADEGLRLLQSRCG